MVVNMSSKGQVVIPSEIRRKLGIKATTKLEIHEENGRIIACPIPENPIQACYGALKLAKSNAEIIHEAREEEALQEERKGSGK